MLRVCYVHVVPVTARGTDTGYCGQAMPFGGRDDHNRDRTARPETHLATADKMVTDAVSPDGLKPVTPRFQGAPFCLTRLPPEPVPIYPAGRSVAWVW